MIDRPLVACTIMCIECVLDRRSRAASNSQSVDATESDELEALQGCFQLWHEEKYECYWYVQILLGDGDYN